MVDIQQHISSMSENALNALNLSPYISPRLQGTLSQAPEAAARERGAICTRREVVEFILDLVGYLPEEDLTQASLLEPSFGSGDFLLVALERLLQSYFLHHANGSKIVPALEKSLLGVEVHQETFFLTQKKVLEVLERYSVCASNAKDLLEAWLKHDDFLLTSLSPKFTHIVGNPPYLRQELIPDQLLTCYRSLYKTIYDRADLYVPFLERSLSPVAKLFISAYSVKMRGGYMRFQAQNIRRICLPRWEDVSSSLRESLISATRTQDKSRCDEAVFELYQLSPAERSVLQA